MEHLAQGYSNKMFKIAGPDFKTKNLSWATHLKWPVSTRWQQSGSRNKTSFPFETKFLLDASATKEQTYAPNCTVYVNLSAL